MRITSKPRDGNSDDAVLTELTEVLEQIVRPTPEPAPKEEHERNPGEPSKRPARAAEQGRPSFADRLRFWSLIGLVALTCGAVMVVARPFSETHPVEPTGPSSVDVATTDPDVQKSSSQAETAAQDGGPRAAAISAELTQWGQTIARELANLDQGLDELKASQAQLARDHAELAGHLKQMQDQMARHDTDFADSLKTAQEEIARGNLSTAAQLEASQDQMTRIGEQLEARQKDADRLGAPKQFPQPNLASQSPSRPNAAQSPKRAPKSPPQSALLPTHSEALPNQH